ncbi:hypothetical protein ENUP19_0080G0100 [Entamoeba nuttalli]|uniref:Hydroxylamine reductase n=2 Tax=Entamoeba nuttalli TaxID=412467 RepID=K2HU38_ENTNP|nr:hydroxylamine reductase [Entamoeba nuttalli P19]EKE39650.1 hydroxylamine reductase [Entamoeba nuttalli P19]|eukprot:XP_008857992.1 hydroxylamine reductase [Entamoeba nuttalli P19]
MEKMFCNQCEQTAKGTGCTVCGVCTKEPIVSNTMDALIYALRMNALVALKAKKNGIEVDNEYHVLTCSALFSTLTNVNFSEKDISHLVEQVFIQRKKLIEKLPKSELNGVEDVEDVAHYIETHLSDKRPNKWNDNQDIQSLMQTIVFGLKGICAYVCHAHLLKKDNVQIFEFIQVALAAGYDGKERTLEDWIHLTLEVGKWSLETMKLLDEANNTLGHPEPTEVLIGHKAGKCILVTGHDLHDLELLLKQTEGKGVNVYTHGEMLPAHGYPLLKKYKHLIGHFGTAWQNQQREFPTFPGAILFTTNCLMKPLPSYKDRVFTTNEVGFNGLVHIGNDKDFTPVIQKALEMEGFTDDLKEDTVTTGFSHHAILEEKTANKLVSLIKEGKIKNIFVVGGCDGAKAGRNYYTELVQKIPKDSIILTCACGKFRFFREKLGDIEGIPRLLDLGQCNDSYSAIVVALKLAEIFKCGVNELPLHLILSWYEQKAVAVLLALLYLGIKNIRIGPSAPAFLTPGVFKYLHDNLNLMMTTTPDNDLANL